MSTAQNDRVTARCQQRLDIMLQQLTDLRTDQVAGFDQLDQPGARLGHDPHIVGKTVQQGRKAGAL